MNKKRDCSKCKDCRTVKAGGNYAFHGCFHNPFRGKMCAEIKACPKEAEAEAHIEAKNKEVGA